MMRVDTYPDHWACRVCGSREPHVHEYGAPGARRFEDHGYDVRDEAEATPRFDREIERVAGYPCFADLHACDGDGSDLD